MTSQIIEALDNVRLENHASARNAAICMRDLPPGSTIISTPALSTVLFSKEKGIRCDACHRRQSELAVTLRKCSRCASYWYCGEICQKNQWKSHHKQICKSYNNYVASQYFQTLSEDEQLDALLLTHLVAETSAHPRSEEVSSPFSIFLSLMPRTQKRSNAPKICPLSSITAPESSYLDDLFDRFDNNNHVVHSHLTPFAHGVFPWASRLFNHSCSPNAVPRYIITANQPVRMEIVSLCKIAQGEEITTPYTDPAISFQQRQNHLEISYGFKCQCRLCHVQQHMNISPIHDFSDPHLIIALEARIQDFVFGSTSDEAFHLPTKALCDELPSELHGLLHDSFLTYLSEKFTDALDNGPYSLALDTGKSIFAVYLCIYPPLYPQIGMHTLELAKTFWNAYITGLDENGKTDRTTIDLVSSAKSYLRIASQILDTFGLEGDPGGPLDEISALRTLISNEELNI